MKTFSLLLPFHMPEVFIQKAFFHTLPKTLLPFGKPPGPVNLPGIGSLLNVLWNGGLQHQHEIMVNMTQVLFQLYTIFFCNLNIKCIFLLLSPTLLLLLPLLLLVILLLLLIIIIIEKSKQHSTFNSCYFNLLLMITC